jgi:hypothetical protein
VAPEHCFQVASDVFYGSPAKQCFAVFEDEFGFVCLFFAPQTAGSQGEERDKDDRLVGWSGCTESCLIAVADRALCENGDFTFWRAVRLRAADA